MNMSDEELEALLGAEPPLADDGFTRRVLARLPAPRRRRLGGILAGSAVLGAGGLALAAPAIGEVVMTPGASPWVLFFVILALAWLPATVALDEA